MATPHFSFRIMRDGAGFSSDLPLFESSGVEYQSKVLAPPRLLIVTGTAITYLKLVTGGVKHHLCVADQASAEFMTLCGCVITQPHSWKRVNRLEGDECSRCADLAFGGNAGKSAPAGS